MSDTAAHHGRARLAVTALLILALGSFGGRAHAQQPVPNDIRAQTLFRACKACHTIEKDGEDMIGPNLWNAYGAKAAAKPDFPYSDALAKSGLTWTEENLSRWLEAPTRFVPGSKMAFPGVPDAADRAALIAYLKSHTD